MDENAAGLVSEFARQVREKTDEVRTLKGRAAEDKQREVALFIGQRIQELMALGISVMEIQDAMRAATDVVPQTYAPDAEENADSEDMDASVFELTYFVPMDEATVTAFAEGKIDDTGLMKIILGYSERPYITMPEGLDLVLTEFGKYPDMEEASGGGEIVADNEGNAFIPEHLDITEADSGYSFLIAEPMVFKTADEVKAISESLNLISEEDFLKKANIKKLIKSGWLDGYDKRSVKKNAEYIIDMLCEEFETLQDIYNIAAGQNIGMLIFAGYEKDEGS